MTIECQFLKMFQVFTFELLTRVPVMGKFPWIEQNAEMWILWQFSETSKLVTKESEGENQIFMDQSGISYGMMQYGQEWDFMKRISAFAREREIRSRCMGVLMMVTRGAKTGRREKYWGRGSQGCQPDLPMKKESSVLVTDLHQDPLLVDLRELQEGGYDWFDKRAERLYGECPLPPISRPNLFCLSTENFHPNLPSLSHSPHPSGEQPPGWDWERSCSSILEQDPSSSPR